MWGGSGFKSWAIMEHYRLTGDKKFLAESIHNVGQLAMAGTAAGAICATPPDGILTYGLMPRGFGDCGLDNADDMYGVFLPHNIWRSMPIGVRWKQPKSSAKPTTRPN